ncbi:DUF2813 domain-containing protein [Vibrio sp. TH_r3]|uniref:DUF2813 domain-containing protein n=1 Tax=Vibrio sp. TH_r3 TaxID=3082084 RepID=UPI0029553C54|nr:DUF2813 domain-containing protein [Vibrio sp. TH_r3]MDV7103493.1 DUF2813 domain-containing protein [Vibrio sp. TH_r3]
MQIQSIEISGFRGIQRLSLTLDDLTTLIGENTWGKSSLLEALSVALPSDASLYQFAKKDFHVNYAIAQPQTQHLQIIITFVTTSHNEERSGRYRKLKPIWLDSPSGYKKIIYRVSATRETHKIYTSYAFLNLEGKVFGLHDPEKLAKELVSLHPVIHIRDSRRFTKNHTNTLEKFSNSKTEQRLENTCRRLLSMPGHVNKGEMKSSLRSMENLIEHYFSFSNKTTLNPKVKRESLLFSASSAGNNNLMQVIENTKDSQTRLLILVLLNTYLRAKGPHQLRRYARPILIIEDPESRLHPTHLSRAWGLLQLIPIQKVLTTNSAELLAAVPIHSIRRLIRKSDKTEAKFVSPHLLSKDELRRISFHIRFHRSNALYARCWLLVEGETEVWLFNELAKLCGYNLAAEGVQIIEFAQSGLKSLIKVAKAYEIDWHVVTDGDAAGKKYATAVKSLLGVDLERHRLTELPNKDIEHYLYVNGFELFFKDMLKIPYDQPIPAKKVIARVLKKHAKPDVALAIVSQCEEKGSTCIPKLIKQILKRVIMMANGNA